MASQLKYKIARNLYDSFQSKTNGWNFSDLIKSLNLLRNKDQIIWRIILPSQYDSSFDGKFILKNQQELLGNKAIKNIMLDNIFDKNNLEIELDIKYFIKDILDSDPTKLSCKPSPKEVIVEFSSPNIAKPFHMGHLRSTIIGNCIANIKKKFGHNVIKMNYLGDWGTQFGMIQLGMNLENYTEEDIKKNPLQVLLKAYVKGNAEAEKDSKLYEYAKKIFCDLEFGNEEITQLWSKYRNWTLEGLNIIYDRLGVSFDEYTWESDYGQIRANNILKILEEKNILVKDEKGRKAALVGEKKIPLLKSDNTTLYLLRDLVALMDRRSKYSFDEMYYVVENGQSEHFQSLLAISLEANIVDGAKLEHVKFGKVRGMSTRKGKGILLSDVLDEAKERIYERQAQSKNIKISLEDKEVADILGVSAIIIRDLRQSRLKDYDFSWENVIRLNGDSGISLQYCHCRLSNLEKESGCEAAAECDPEALLEPEAINLIVAIAKYEESLWNSSKKLEPCALVVYMCDLVRAVNVAYKRLNVKDAESHVASQRLLMFKKSRHVLSEGLTLLGIRPITKM